MADDITAKRDQIAATRARIDDHLEELTGHVPAKGDVKAVATKYGAAVGAAVVALGALVIVTKSKLSARADRKAGAEYAKALVAALPQVAEAYRARVSNEVVTAVVPAASPMQDAIDVDELLDAAARPRGGTPTALLTGLGVIAGVAIAKAIDEG